MDPRQKALEAARGLEKAGKLEAAAHAFRDLGAADDAARVLSTLKRPKDAAKVLVESLGVRPQQAGQLDAPGKKKALMAAILFGKAGELAAAIELFVALGERSRAGELLRRSGDEVGASRLESGADAPTATLLASAPRNTSPQLSGATEGIAERLEASGKLEPALSAFLSARRFSDAARVAGRLGRKAEAAQLHLEAGEPVEAAEAWLAAGDRRRGLDALVRVPRDDPRYRAAAGHAIALGLVLGELPFELEHFIGRFLKSDPTNPGELAAFSAAARLYESRHMRSEAAEALRKVVAKDPRFEGADARLTALESELRPSASDMGRMVGNADLHFRALQGTSEPLPDLPDLPGLQAPSGAPTFQSLPPRPGTGGRTELFASAPAVTSSGDELRPGAETQPRPAAADQEPVGPGAVIAGRYRIEVELGRGGMATVYRAHDLELEEDVALKVFPGPGTPELVARFKQELKLSRQVVHANVVRLYDIGGVAGRRYISMELLVGQTLKQRLLAPFTPRDALGWLVQACHGLQAAHDQGVIHRDVKPDNFFLTSAGVLKVMDFGIAKAQAAPGLTTGNAVAGTPAYMSPEQIAAFSSVTPASDLYALGVCAYEMFAGALPFVHPEVVPLLMMHLQQPPMAPRERNPAISEPLERLILSLLEKDPRNRPQSCREVAELLAAVTLS